jgi:general secretion pathway protein D
MKLSKLAKVCSLCLGVCIVLAGCTSTKADKWEQKSYLSTGEDNPQNESLSSTTDNSGDDKIDANKANNQSGLSFIAPYNADQGAQSQDNDMLAQFNELAMVSVTADSLQLKDYLHYVLGELLGVSYILGEGVEDDKKSVTLNLQEPVSKKKLFTLSQEVLAERGYTVRYADNLFYIQNTKGNNNQSDTVFSYGNTANSVPDTSMDIVQIVPFNYGSQVSVGPLLQKFINVKSTAYPHRDVVMLQGKRRDILRSLELVAILDQPIFKNRSIGMFRPTYVSLDIIAESLPDLLDQEGIKLTEKSNNAAVSVVKLDRLNTLFLFANKKELIERAVYWAEQIDKPSETEEEQYYIYVPQFSRAVDLGESLTLLISDAASLGNSTSASRQNDSSTNREPSSSSVASNKNVKMVVDERANTLIFKTTGKDYKQLLPLIKRLDILPKQIALEVIIAEVTLTDKFRQGVEFALNNGNYAASTTGALGAAGFGGLSYVLTGANGRVSMNLFQSDSLVNVLSRPSIVVRDGVSAQINVGTDIPVIGETTIDPNDNNSIARTSIEYRKTGVELSVTPTVNAQGIVTMVIQQSISSQVSDVSTVSGSPAIFERSISTEVIAQDGQTIILGGLISDNTSQGTTRVPILSDIPFIGQLFTAKSNSGDKTELVVMVTPKIIDSSNEWENLKRQLNTQLDYLKLN